MKKLSLLLVLALLIAIVASGIYYFRHRFVRSDEDLLAILPAGDLTSFYVNVEALRDAKLLGLLTGTRVAQEPEYKKFVHEISFDYTRDLERLAGASDGRQIFFLLRGRFNWEKLRRYPENHGGWCLNHVCSVPATTPGRWASFHLIQPNVLALAFSSDTVAVNVLQPPATRRLISLPPEPVWLKPSSSILKNPGDLPLPLRIFAISLQSSDPVILSAGPAAEGSGAAFKLQLSAGCVNESTAETIRNQLEIETRMLQLELRREGKQLNAADLTGLLTAGSFQIANKHVVGSWPVRRELIQSLE